MELKERSAPLKDFLSKALIKLSRPIMGKSLLSVPLAYAMAWLYLRLLLLSFAEGRGLRPFARSKRINRVP